MRLLLDTNALLWTLFDDSRLAAAAKAAIIEPSNEVYVSAASVWEIALKSALGKLQFTQPSPRWLASALSAQQFSSLPITSDHALAVVDLPLHHRDPFDRILIAQALVEGLTIVTSDAAFRAYKISILRT